jgi:hypothetical protein
MSVMRVETSVDEKIVRTEQKIRDLVAEPRQQGAVRMLQPLVNQLRKLRRERRKVIKQAS